MNQPFLIVTLISASAVLAFSACGVDAPKNANPTSSASSATSAAGGNTSGTGGGSAAGGAPATGGATANGGNGASGGAGGQGGAATLANCTPPTGTQGNLGVQTHVTGLNSPLLVTFAPGDPDRLFIVEKQGVIRVFRNGMLKTFLDLSGIVSTAENEMGLLGLAFHPDYQTNRRFFVHYTATNNVTTVAEYARSVSEPDQAVNNQIGDSFFTLTQPHGNHNGGSIEFSPVDGFLYIGLGDGGSGGDPDNYSQDLTSALGALLRIDVSTNPPTNPPGNKSGAGVDPRIFDWGLRNPYRFNFDPCTGDRYIGDVGQNAYEEIDVAAATEGPLNWGWRLKEGKHCYNPATNCDPSNMTVEPAIEHQQDSYQSITGGHVYRGSEIPWLRGAYVYGDFITQRVDMFRWDSGNVTDDQELTGLGGKGNLSCFGQDALGELYLCDYYGGNIYKVVAQ